MATVDLEKEVRDLKRRVDLAETKLSQMDGRRAMTTGPMLDIQHYLLARFGNLVVRRVATRDDGNDLPT